MRFALVDGQRREAESGLSGECDGCESALVAKCGEVRVRHWAHRARRNCDPWWENETEWHRSWKARFPDHWQEILHHATDGERHRADVKTAHGWALEFQHSFIKPEERRSREAFYAKLMWVVDGTRRKRDKAQLIVIDRHLPRGSCPKTTNRSLGYVTYELRNEGPTPLTAGLKLPGLTRHRGDLPLARGPQNPA
jgi:competence CoiA-like predicted nuclease